MRYATRNHAFAPACTWVLNDGMLQREVADGGPPAPYLLATVTKLRLDFHPTRADRNCFRCRLRLRDGRRLELLNRTWRGPLNFVDTSADYVAFVTALVAEVHRHAPGCRFAAGTTPLHYAVNLGATAFIALCFAAIAWFLARVNLTWMVGIKIVVILFYLPTLLRWLSRNRPRGFTPPAIPADVLPTASPPT
jgi:hypothetical protein